MKKLNVNFDYFIDHYRKLRLRTTTKFKKVINREPVYKYRVHNEEPLWNILMSKYGTGRYINELIAFNKKEYNNVLDKELVSGKMVYLPRIEVLKKYTVKEEPISKEGKKEPEEIEFLNPLLDRYIVKQGENLPLIAYKYYNDKTYYKELAKYNKIDNLSSIRVGTRLDIPYLVELVELRNVKTR